MTFYELLFVTWTCGMAQRAIVPEPSRPLAAALGACTATVEAGRYGTRGDAERELRLKSPAAYPRLRYCTHFGLKCRDVDVHWTTTPEVKWPT